MLSFSWIILPAVIILLKLKKDRQNANSNNLPLPPGPPPLPLIGNLFDLPTSYQWLKFAEWRKQYGDVVHARALDKHIIILNTLEATNDLLEKRSSRYSSRPRMPMLKELSGWTWALSVMEYGAIWREHRKAVHQYFHPTASLKYRPDQLTSTRRMLHHLLVTPDEFMQIIRLTLTTTILKTLYGFEVQDMRDPFVVNAEEVLGSLAAAGIPGAFMVDTFPILKYVPSWFPGAGFRKIAEYWRNLLPAFVDKPFDGVQTRLREGTAVPCVASDLLERIREKGGSEHSEMVAKNACAIGYAGGADTTVSTLQTFILAMALYPEIQRKAQAQLDKVVGDSRLPDFEDIETLPYIVAMVKELLRWQPVTPLAVVHASTEDDEYKGYFIPKGSLVFGNAWLILHDEQVYPDPMSFIPERFLKSDGSLNSSVQDPMLAAFGFGRRICPGRHFAYDSALIAVANVLATFNIELPENVRAGEKMPAIEMSPGLLSHPKPFKCRIIPRSRKAVMLIQQTVNHFEE